MNSTTIKRVAGGTPGLRKRMPFRRYFQKNYELYIMILPSLACLLLFRYVPILGNLIAFQKYRPTSTGTFLGSILENQWIGFDNFVKFFHSPFFGRLLGNTFLLGIVTILFTFPAPILLALLMNEIRHRRFKKTIQTISYVPYFISAVVIIGLFKEMMSINDGIINNIIAALGFDKIYFFGESQWFRPIYVITSLWSGIGYGTIIYLSAISGINPELYESAVLDGASRFRQAVHITLPSISNTIIVLFIMTIGGIVSCDVSKILLIYSPLTYETADVIGTYVYREGILGGSYSYTTAISLFTTAINLIFVFGTNWISRRVSDTSLF